VTPACAASSNINHLNANPTCARVHMWPCEEPHMTTIAIVSQKAGRKTTLAINLAAAADLAERARH
jgi:hypothetical protein